MIFDMLDFSVLLNRSNLTPQSHQTKQHHIQVILCTEEGRNNEKDNGNHNWCDKLLNHSF